MLYTVAELSDMLGFSKVTIYNKINSLKTDLKPCIKHKKGITYIDDKGVLIIKRDLGLNQHESTLNSNDDFKVEDILEKINVYIDNREEVEMKEFVIKGKKYLSQLKILD